MDADSHDRSAARRFLRGYAVLGLVGAAGAYLVGGSGAIGTYVDVLIPATVLVSLLALAVEYEASD